VTRTDSSDSLLDVLQRYWGYDRLLPHQGEAIEAVLEGRDSVVVLPTGGGKSLCFQAPVLIQGGLALVVSPLISLMKDQVDGLRANGVPAACFNSSMDREEQQRVIRELRDGTCRILYVSPERLIGGDRAGFRALLAGCDLRYVAIDEAHCISQWGHEFRPEYRELGALREVFPRISMHAYTATASEPVRRDIATQLRLEAPELIVGSFDRPNLVYRVRRRASLRAQVRQVIERHRGEAGIVYCITRKEVDALAEHLVGLGFRAVPYHAGLEAEVRRCNQELFSNEQVDVVVATVAFGMGIDRSNVRFVIHAGAPRSLEHYQQETGRAGRDGLEAECVLIWSGADLKAWERILDLSGALTDGARRHLQDMARYASQVRCRHRAIVEHFGQSLENEDCGACDVCLGELEAVGNSVVLAQKILSCVVRVRERWGVGHVIDVLRGRSADRVVASGHDQLSTFGLLEGCPVAELRGYVEQLVDHGFLARTGSDYPLLAMTDEGWRVLRDDAGLQLYRQRKPEPRRRKRARAEATSWEGVDADLFEALRAIRMEIAEGRGVPPYVVFHDSALRDMARVRPSTPEALCTVYGVGEKKVADLGGPFLEAIAAHCRAEGLEQDVGV